MKKLILILLLLCSITVKSQDKRFAAYLYTEAADKNTHNEGFDYDLNIGAGLEYQMHIIYFKASMYVFPGLNDLDYLDLQGTVLGLNTHLGPVRVFTGGKIGFLLREGDPYPMHGIEGGIEYYFDEFGLYVGVQGSIDERGDEKHWNPKGNYHTVKSIGVKVGWSWKGKKQK